MSACLVLPAPAVADPGAPGSSTGQSDIGPATEAGKGQAANPDKGAPAEQGTNPAKGEPGDQGANPAKGEPGDQGANPSTGKAGDRGENPSKGKGRGAGQEPGKPGTGESGASTATPTADPSSGTQEPTNEEGPDAEDPHADHDAPDAGSEDGHDHSQDGETIDSPDGLTPEQRATLEMFQRAVEQKNEAAVSVSVSLEAANLAAGVAAKASALVYEANQAAAAAELNAATANLEAARLQGVVAGYAHEMALGEVSGNETLVSLVLEGKEPAEVLRMAESSERTADTITDSLRELVAATEAAEQAGVEARTAQAEAALRVEEAETKAAEAVRLLTAARARFRATDGTLSKLVSGDVVLTHASSTTGIPGCADAAEAGMFPNGMLPDEVLCEPTMAPGHRFRSDAARAFDALARAYAADMGEPICITDSYRSLPAQVELKIRKPYLAATPGTSNHGWGVATDMCGGIETFGTPQHEWMRANAYLFGFMHPSWAQATGSKPEAWHWEFSPELAAQMGTMLTDVAEELDPKDSKAAKGSESKQGESEKGQEAAEPQGRKPKS